MDAEAHELIAGYALDALSPDDRARAKELLERSEEAREELRAFSETTAAMATATAGAAPRPELRARILDAARTEGQTVVSLDAKRRSRLVPALGAAAALAACAALALGVWGLSVSSDLDDSRAALEHSRTAAAVLSDPAARTVALQEGDGRLVVREGGEAVLVLDAIEPAPAGKTYELWVLDGETPKRAGLFPGGEGRDVVPVEGTVAPGAQVLVTVEREGGVDAPTTAPVVASQPV
ncbi:MAG TPA: anti-sigma factor [Gaiella sp.]|nr:anti-sigma factor [Gaiella sp.]